MMDNRPLPPVRSRTRPDIAGKQASFATVTAEEPADAYEVGYGKPPVGTRFKPGQSGNPAGRPRGSKSEATVARAVLSETFPVTLKGRRRNIAVFEASFRRQCQKALEGDAKAFAIVERYQQKHVPELAAVNQDVDEAGPGASLISEIFLDMARQAVAKERGGEIEP